MDPILKLDNFNGGLSDAYGVSKDPPTTFQAGYNLVPTRTGSLETTHGYSTTGGLAALPTAFPVTGPGTGTVDVSKIVWEPFPFSSEVPTAYDGRLYHVQDSASASRYMLNTWFKNSATAYTALNSGFVFVDERKVCTTAGTDWTIVGNSLVVANANSVYGLSITNDYYSLPPWQFEIVPFGAFLLVTGYSYSAGTATFTFQNDVSTMSTPFSAGLTVTLRRWFHRAKTEFTFGSQPGQSFATAGKLRSCGGSSSTSTFIPWVSQYIDRTFFTGHAKALIYKGTYVDEMECRGVRADILYPIFNSQVVAPGGVTALPAASYHFAYTLEFDGYEEGALSFDDPSLVTNFYTTNGTTQIITFDIRIFLANLSKRVTAVNLYVSQIIGGVASEHLFIRRYDIVNPTSDQLDATYGWTYPAGTSNAFLIDDGSGTVSNSKYQVRLDGNQWNDRGSSYLERTGRAEEFTTPTISGAPSPTQQRNYVVWDYTENVNGRQFFASFYDPNTATFERDQLRFTGFDFNSAPNPDIIPADRLFSETDVASGDPSSIQGIIEDKGSLVIFKDSSVYAVTIGPQPETWIRYTISKADGLYAPKTLGKLPEGRGIYFGDVDHFKMITNQRVVVLTNSIPSTYYNLSNKATLRAFYDKIDRSICIVDGVSKLFYRGYLDLAYQMSDGKNAVPWYPCYAGHNLEFSAIERDGSVIFTLQTTPYLVYKWHKTDYTDAGTAILPYLKTQKVLLDPTSEVLLDKVMIYRPVVGTAGTLTNKITIDGTSATFSDQTKTMVYLYQHIPVMTLRECRSFSFEYNFLAVDGFTGGESLSSGKIQLGGLYVFGEVIMALSRSEV